MASFEQAINKVLKYEGGYANNSSDKGGETYMGISRKANPKNAIWPIIDEYKKKYTTKSTLNAALKKDNNITQIVKKTYKSNYWDKFKLDKMYNQRLAENIFDDCVNRGVGATAYSLHLLLGIEPCVKKVSTQLLNKLKYY